MLYLMRKEGEAIVINHEIELVVVEVKGRAVKLGFQFPKGASVLRKELYDKIMAESNGDKEKLVSLGIMGNLPSDDIGNH